MRDNGSEPREEKIRALFPLVKRIARRVRRLVPSVDLDDLIGDGSVGLIRAVDAFDASRGPTLEQYARSVIVGAMLNGIRRMDPVSERVRRTVRDGETQRYTIAAERGYVPSIAEIDGVVPGFARAMLAAHRSQPLSLDSPLPDGETLGRNWSDDPAEIVECRSRRDAVHAALSALPERQRALMQHHYFGDRSLREIGRAMNISAQRASQLHLAAMAKLKRTLHVTAS